MAYTKLTGEILEGQTRLQSQLSQLCTDQTVKVIRRSRSRYFALL
jgi:hypothetical protein